MTLTAKQKWLIIGIETAFTAALAVWILLRLGRLFEPIGLFVAITIIVIGDLATALLMEHFAPTRITLEPGEANQMIGRAVGDFSIDGVGGVVLRGERWRAECSSERRLVAGEPVRVVARTGLTLRVERLENQ